MFADYEKKECIGFAEKEVFPRSEEFFPSKPFWKSADICVYLRLKFPGSSPFRGHEKALTRVRREGIRYILESG